MNSKDILNYSPVLSNIRAQQPQSLNPFFLLVSSLHPDTTHKMSSLQKGCFSNLGFMTLNVTLLQKMCKMGWNYFKSSTTLHIVGFQKSGVFLTFWLPKCRVFIDII